MTRRKKLVSRLFVFLLAFAVVFTYSVMPMSQAYAATKKPKKITITATSKTVDIKGKVTVSVKSVSPKGASKSVTYKSSNKKIATVSSKGVVTGKKKGTVKITATSKVNKKVKKTITIKVKQLKASSIKMSSSSKSLEIGETAKLKATVKPVGVYAPLTWKSSNTKVAKVDKYGKVTAVAGGTATISASTTKAKAGKALKATCKVTVKTPKPDTAPTLDNINVRKMTTVIDMSDAKYDGNVVRVWVPVPQNTDEQTIWGETFDAPAAAASSGWKNEPNSGWNNKMLYLEWSADTPSADRKATLSFNVSRYEVSRSDLKEDSSAGIPADVKPYITKESNYVKVKADIVKKYAAEATKGKSGTLDKARAIYDWCIANLERIDNNEELEGTDGQTHKFIVIGCGYGDTVQILKDHEAFGRAGGHCTDINSTFVALCRASGIPAREMFGIRLSENATGGQHCWAQFYLPGTGWVYADPGDVLKFGVKENKSNRNMTLAELAEARKSALTAEYTAKYWGGVDNNRVELSRGRDVILEPAQKAAEGPYNTFGYPCGEFGNDEAGFTRIECTDAKNFVYTISCADIAAEASDVEAIIDGTDTASKLVDARTADAFEGWALDGAANGGHLKNAVNVSAQWLATDYESVAAENKTRDEAIQKEIDANGIKADDKIIVYDTNSQDAKNVQTYLVGKGYSDVSTYDAKADLADASKVEACEAYTDYYIPADVVKSISDYVVSGTEMTDAAKAVVGDKPVKILHAEWYTDVNDTSYAGSGHVPGAVPITTDEFEPEREQRTGDSLIRQDGVTYGNRADIGWSGDYLLVDDAKAIELAEKYGVNKDDCVIVVGYEPMSTCKIALVLKYLGADSTYVMSAAYNEWNLKGFDLETKINEPVAADFGTDKPLNPDLIDTQDEAAEMLKDPANYQLVDTRTVEEFKGLDTGYGYHDIAGKIPGADINSPSGIGYSSGMYFYRNADKTMRSKSVIEDMWAEQGVDTSKHVSFFCGSGWRAAEETWDALAMGYTNVSMYNDGWQGWSNAGRPFIDKDGKELKLYNGKLVSASFIDFTTVSDEEWQSYGTEALAEGDYIVDVRATADFDAAHIPGAINVPTDGNAIAAGSEAAAGLDAAFEAAAGKRIVLICYSGKKFAKAAMTYLYCNKEGLSPEKVTFLIGGNNDYPADQKIPTFFGMGEEWPSYGISALDYDNDYILDVRDADTYKAGHFEGSVNVPTDGNEILAGSEAAAGLEAVFEAAAGKRIVIICYGGNKYARRAMDYLYSTKGNVGVENVTYLIGGANGNIDAAKEAGKWVTE